MFLVRGTVYSIDLEDLEAGWTTHPNDMPTARGGAIFAMVDELLWTFGGEKNLDDTVNFIYDQVEVLNTTSEEWTTLTPMKVPRHGFIPAYVDGAIYMPGGATMAGEWPTNYTDKYILPAL